VTVDPVARLTVLAERISAAAAAAGRPADPIELLIATKTVEPQRILPVLRAGYRLIGENRVQEVTGKAAELATEPHTTHFIGHLQRNKVNQVLPAIDCLQTLDDADLAEALQTRLDRVLDVMIQVNVSGEPSKSGVAPDGARGLLDAVARHDRLRVVGWMTIGLNSPDTERVRAGYETLRGLRDDARQQGWPGAEHAVALSMGMSGDFETAIGAGATMVRLGSAVFGARPAA
jgi:PLP dependent protein